MNSRFQGLKSCLEGSYEDEEMMVIEETEEENDWRDYDYRTSSHDSSVTAHFTNPMFTMNSTTNSMSNNLHQSRLSSNLNQSLPASTLPSSIRQEQAQQAQPPPTQHRRSHSLNLAAALNRRVSKKNQLPGQVIGNQTGIHTLPIIQPDPYWNSYQNNRHFKINLRQPRQQVTSLLALSSIPRPITPPLHEDLEPNVTTLIENVTRLVMEEEATNAAIAASLQTLENEVNLNENLNRLNDLNGFTNSNPSSSLSTSPTPSPSTPPPPPPPEFNDSIEINFSIQSQSPTSSFDQNPFRKLLKNSNRIQLHHHHHHHHHHSNLISTLSSSSSSSSSSSDSQHPHPHQDHIRSNSISTNPFTS